MRKWRCSCTVAMFMFMLAMQRTCVSDAHVHRQLL
jgi:hypothetical protein